MKTKYHRMLVLMLAAGLMLSGPAYVAAQEKTTAKPAKTSEGVDLRPKMKEMKEGKNLLYSGREVKITAVVKDGKVARWSATGPDGKTLPTVLRRGKVSCQVCIKTTDEKTGQEKEHCYPVDCDRLPPPKKLAAE